MNKLEIVRACTRCGKLQKKNEKESNANWYDINAICECGGNFAYMPKYESDSLRKEVLKSAT